MRSGSQGIAFAIGEPITCVEFAITVKSFIVFIVDFENVFFYSHFGREISRLTRKIAFFEVFRSARHIPLFESRRALFCDLIQFPSCWSLNLWVCRILSSINYQSASCTNLAIGRATKCWTLAHFRACPRPLSQCEFRCSLFCQFFLYNTFLFLFLFLMIVKLVRLA